MDETLHLDVEGMTCGNCRRHVTQALLSVQGVEHATVDLGAGTAEVQGRGVDRAALARAVADAGYRLTTA